MSTLVGKPAPRFSTRTIVDGFPVESYSLDQFLDKKYVSSLLSEGFHLCLSTELHAFQEKLSEFHARNVEVVGCSTDTLNPLGLAPDPEERRWHPGCEIPTPG